MTWKAYRQLFLTAVILCVSACSNHIALDHNLGAITQGREFTPPHIAHFATASVNADGRIANPYDFLKQLQNVYQHSATLSSTFDTTYRKVNTWVRSGGRIQDLARFGLFSRQMRGQDGYQNVLMTGYYIPVIQARLTPQGNYRYPIYAIPKGMKKYTRAEIYNGALYGKGLELAYTQSLLDNFLMEVQGSGFIDLGGGQLRHLAYGSKNGYSYTSIGRLLVEDGEIAKEKMSIQAIQQWAKQNPDRLRALLERNQSFVYFRNDPTFDVKGSAKVPLVAHASAASDKNIVPTGSILLVETPLIDYHGNWTGKHQLRLMIALDVGGAVKSQHFDLYQGIGDEAGHRAGLMKHYGRVWLLN